MVRVWALAVVVTLCVCGCSSPQPELVHLQGQTMGTTYNIKFPAMSGINSQLVKEKVDARLIAVNKLMSTYDPTSELSRFNQSRFDSAFTVSSETLKVIKEAVRLNALSEGYLDVSVGPLVNLWGFGPTLRPEFVPTQAEIDAIRPYVGLDKLIVEYDALRKLHPQLYIDLSTIAKGYGVDVVADLIEANGINNYLVEIGGEMRVKGEKAEGAPWIIAIEKPLSNERAIQKLIAIGNNAIATSGDYRLYFEQDGVRYSHLINPKTGHPIAHNTVAVSVIHPSSMTADGLATAFNVMDYQRAVRIAEENNLAVLIITKEGDAFHEYSSPAFNALASVY